MLACICLVKMSKNSFTLRTSRKACEQLICDRSRFNSPKLITMWLKLIPPPWSPLKTITGWIEICFGRVKLSTPLGNSQVCVFVAIYVSLLVISVYYLAILYACILYHLLFTYLLFPFLIVFTLYICSMTVSDR